MVVRSVIGKHYARVGIANLLPLLIFALLDRLPECFSVSSKVSRLDLAASVAVVVLTINV
jgi:hypothetical protein